VTGTPKISIIVPVYQVEAYLRKCLDSIVNQTYRNLQIILVDDGSPDNCGEICDTYAAGDRRIQVIHQKNGGVSAARNAGLALANGDYIGWVDSDDWIELDMYEYLLKNAQNYDADIAVCGHYKVYKRQKVSRGWKSILELDKKQGLKLLLENDTLQNYCCDKLFRAKLWEGIVFPEGRTYEDIAVMHRLFERAEQIICLPEAKYNYFQRPGSIVTDQSMQNRLNHYRAARERYGELAERWPELEYLLVDQCAASAMGLWCAYYSNPKAERTEMYAEIKEISAFCTPHIQSAAKNIGLGLAGRIVLRLIPYPKWWAFLLAGFFSWLYKLKHGRNL